MSDLLTHDGQNLRIFDRNNFKIDSNLPKHKKEDSSDLKAQSFITVNEDAGVPWNVAVASGNANGSKEKKSFFLDFTEIFLILVTINKIMKNISVEF